MCLESWSSIMIALLKSAAPNKPATISWSVSDCHNRVFENSGLLIQV
jgi:hypothetical protein